MKCLAVRLEAMIWGDPAPLIHPYLLGWGLGLHYLPPEPFNGFSHFAERARHACEAGQLGVVLRETIEMVA